MEKEVQSVHAAGLVETGGTAVSTGNNAPVVGAGGGQVQSYQEKFTGDMDSLIAGLTNQTQAAPVNSQVVTEEPAPTPAKDETSPEPEQKEPVQTLDDLLTLAEKQNPDLTATKSDPAPNVEVLGVDFSKIDYSSEAAQAADVWAQEQFGQSLQDLVTNYQQVAQQYQATQQEISRQESLKLANQLKSAWGVNDAEFDRRTKLVADYITKLPADIQRLYDNPDGFQLVYNRLESQTQAASQVAPSSSAPPVTQEIRTFSNAEIRRLQRNDPAKYDELLPLITAARKAGKITD